MKKTILITGARGMFGQDAARLFLESGYDVLSATKADLDVTNLAQVQEFFAQKKIDFVLHAAAYTKVDDAETNRDLAFLINGEGAKNVAIASNEKSVPIIFISTDYVFDGEKGAPYLVSDKTNTINVYGASKIAGEENVRQENPRHYIVRTSWLYGKNGKNFVDTMIALAKNRKSLKVVNDQFGCPTWTMDLAQGVKNLIEKEMPFGTYQLCGAGVTSWFGLAKKIFEILEIEIEVIPVNTEEFPRPAKRPKFSAMDNQGSCRNWQEMLFDYIKSNRSMRHMFSLGKIINFEVKGDDRGILVALEGNKNVPFDIKRVYYISGTKEGIRRGFHAHKDLEQVLICVSGSCKILLDNGDSKEEILLNSPSSGLLIKKMIWREMFDFSSDCVLMVLANDYYSEDDYIRNYEDFLRLKSIS